MGRHRSVVGPILLVLLILTLGVGGLDPTPGVTTSSAAGSTAGATGPQSLSAISCPSATVCFAVGGQGDKRAIFATHDAGRTWQRQTSGMMVGPAIDCPTVSVCFALVNTANCGELLRTTDGGSTWTKKPPALACLGPPIACPSVTTCYALSLSGEFLRTTDGGRSWQARGTIPPELDPHSLACPSTTVCYLAGDDKIGRTTDGGQTWQISDFTFYHTCHYDVCHEFDAIACPSPRICYAGGLRRGGVPAMVAATTDGGQTWRLQPVPRLGAFGMGGTSAGVVSVSCPAPIECFALGWAGHMATTTDGGVTWRVGLITKPYPFGAIACLSTTVCYAAGEFGRLMRTMDGGTTWHDLIPAIFVSGTYGTKQPLHTYSRWFTATHPWHVALGVNAGGGRPFNPMPPHSNCPGVAGVTVYVQNTAKTRVAGPIHSWYGGAAAGEYRRTVMVIGRLRLDVVSARCPDVAVRIDGVK